MTASRSIKRVQGRTPARFTAQRPTRPEQPVPARQECAQVLPQESTIDSFMKEAPGIPFEDEIRSIKTVELDNVYLVSAEAQSVSNGNGFSAGTGGDRLHFRYSDPIYHPSDSDDEDSSQEEARDLEVVESCIRLFSNCVSRRISRAMMDLIGIEPNPGPKGKMGVNQGTINSVMRSLGLSPSKQNKKKKKNASGGKQSRAANQSGNRRIPVTGVPAAFGMVAPRAYFTMGGQAQRLADQDPLNAVRARGCALLRPAVEVNWSVSSSVNGAFGSGATPDLGYAIITPNTVDPRLNALAQTFQYYAFRRLVLKYIPFVGTTTQGGLYLAIAKDADQAVENFEISNPNATTPPFSGGTPQNIMEYDPSLMTAIWQPAQLSFQHAGTELWQTFPNGEEPTNERIQAVIVGILEALTSDGTIFGHLWLEYEIDFYVPGPPLGPSPSTGSGPSFFQSYAPTPVSMAIPTTPTLNTAVLTTLGASEYSEGESINTASFVFPSGTSANVVGFAVLDALTGAVLRTIAPLAYPTDGYTTVSFPISLVGLAAQALQLVAYGGIGASTIFVANGFWKSAG